MTLKNCSRDSAPGEKVLSTSDQQCFQAPPEHWRLSFSLEYPGNAFSFLFACDLFSSCTHTVPHLPVLHQFSLPQHPTATGMGQEPKREGIWASGYT